MVASASQLFGFCTLSLCVLMAMGSYGLGKFPPSLFPPMIAANHLREIHLPAKDVVASPFLPCITVFPPWRFAKRVFPPMKSVRKVMPSVGAFPPMTVVTLVHTCSGELFERRASLHPTITVQQRWWGNRLSMDVSVILALPTLHIMLILVLFLATLHTKKSITQFQRKPTAVGNYSPCVTPRSANTLCAPRGHRQFVTSVSSTRCPAFLGAHTSWAENWWAAATSPILAGAMAFFQDLIAVDPSFPCTFFLNIAQLCAYYGPLFCPQHAQSILLTSKCMVVMWLLRAAPTTTLAITLVTYSSAQDRAVTLINSLRGVLQSAKRYSCSGGAGQKILLFIVMHQLHVLALRHSHWAVSAVLQILQTSAGILFGLKLVSRHRECIHPFVEDLDAHLTLHFTLLYKMLITISSFLVSMQEKLFQCSNCTDAYTCSPTLVSPRIPSSYITCVTNMTRSTYLLIIGCCTAVRSYLQITGYRTLMHSYLSATGSRIAMSSCLLITAHRAVMHPLERFLNVRAHLYLLITGYRTTVHSYLLITGYRTAVHSYFQITGYCTLVHSCLSLTWRFTVAFHYLITACYRALQRCTSIAAPNIGVHQRLQANGYIAVMPFSTTLGGRLVVRPHPYSALTPLVHGLSFSRIHSPCATRRRCHRTRACTVTQSLLSNVNYSYESSCFESRPAERNNSELLASLPLPPFALGCASAWHFPKGHGAQHAGSATHLRHTCTAFSLSHGKIPVERRCAKGCLGTQSYLCFPRLHWSDHPGHGVGLYLRLDIFVHQSRTHLLRQVVHKCLSTSSLPGSRGASAPMRQFVTCLNGGCHCMPELCSHTVYPSIYIHVISGLLNVCFGIHTRNLCCTRAHLHARSLEDPSYQLYDAHGVRRGTTDQISVHVWSSPTLASPCRFLASTNPCIGGVYASPLSHNGGCEAPCTQSTRRAATSTHTCISMDHVGLVALHLFAHHSTRHNLLLFGYHDLSHNSAAQVACTMDSASSPLYAQLRRFLVSGKHLLHLLPFHLPPASGSSYPLPTRKLVVEISPRAGRCLCDDPSHRAHSENHHPCCLCQLHSYHRTNHCSLVGQHAIQLGSSPNAYCHHRVPYLAASLGQMHRPTNCSIIRGDKPRWHSSRRGHRNAYHNKSCAYSNCTLVHMFSRLLEHVSEIHHSAMGNLPVFQNTASRAVAVLFVSLACETLSASGPMCFGGALLVFTAGVGAMHQIVPYNGGQLAHAQHSVHSLPKLAVGTLVSATAARWGLSLLSASENQQSSVMPARILHSTLR